MTSNLRFIVDINVGKLARWLRMIGYDTLLFSASDDSQMVATALAEGRVMLTKDTQIMKRGVITSGRIRAILIEGDSPEEQMPQVVTALKLDCQSGLFTICLECNQPLEARDKQQVQNLVPAYVFQTQSQYQQCPVCQRIYWRGTHWQAMAEQVKKFVKDSAGENIELNSR